MNKKDIVNLIKGNILNIKTLKRTHREIRVEVLLNDGDKYIFSLDKFYEPGYITPSSFLLNVYKQEVSHRTFFWGLLSKKRSKSNTCFFRRIHLWFYSSN